MKWAASFWCRLTHWQEWRVRWDYTDDKRVWLECPHCDACLVQFRKPCESCGK